MCTFMMGVCVWSVWCVLILHLVLAISIVTDANRSVSNCWFIITTFGRSFRRERKPRSLSINIDSKATGIIHYSLLISFDVRFFIALLNALFVPSFVVCFRSICNFASLVRWADLCGFRFMILPRWMLLYFCSYFFYHLKSIFAIVVLNRDNIHGAKCMCVCVALAEMQ